MVIFPEVGSVMNEQLSGEEKKKENWEFCFEFRYRFLFYIEVKILNQQMNAKFRDASIWNESMETLSVLQDRGQDKIALLQLGK